jgi:hypothetical protein
MINKIIIMKRDDWMDLNTLNEMPQLVDFDFKKANGEIRKILSKEKIDDFELEDSDLNLYSCYNGSSSTSGEAWFIIFNQKKDDVEFIVKLKNDAVLIDGKKYKVMVPYHTYKTGELVGVTKKVYEYVNKKFDVAIMSDKKQTKAMVEIWLSWFENQSKYNIKTFKFVDTTTDKSITIEEIEKLPHGFVNSFEIGGNYRMVVDFHQIMKEATPIVLKTRSHGKFFGKEGTDWVVDRDLI